MTQKFGAVWPLELSETLKEALKEYINNPVVTVMVVEAMAAQAHVMGEVNHQGPVTLQGNINVVQALALACGLATPAHPQDEPTGRPAANPDRPLPFKNRSFRIPFQVDPADRGRIKEVQLWVSTDMGRSWRQAGRTSSDQTSFPAYHAPRDGEYWFAVRTLDTQGRLYPTDEAKVAPSMKVLVDTAPLAEVTTRLEPLTARDRPFRHTARELLALAAYRAGDAAAAKRWHEMMIADAETPEATRSRVDVLMALSADAKG